MDKSPDAFRTISEVAEILDIPAHVLRFWETRFPQIRPVKRAGGRRYYRPTDIALLTGIKHLLHEQGLTIRGVQKIMREQGVRHVAAMGAAGCAVDEDEKIEEQLSAALGLEKAEPVEHDAAETAQIIALETVLAQKEAARSATRDPAVRPVQGNLFADLTPDPSNGATVTESPEEIAEAPFIEVEEEAETLAPPLSFPVKAVAVADDDTPAPDCTDALPDVAQSESVAAESGAGESGATETGSADSADAAEPPDAALLRVAPRLRKLNLVGKSTLSTDLRPLRARMVSLRARLADGSRKRPR